MKEIKNNVAQFPINERFTLSLSDWFCSGDGFEAVLIDRDKDNLIGLPKVWGFKDLKNAMSRAIEKANEIIKNEALENVNFLEL